MWTLFSAETVYAMPGASVGGESGGALVQLLPFVAVFAIIYFLVIRPQQRRAKAHRELVSNLRRGDEIWTDSGIRATIQRVHEDSLTVEIAPKVTVRIQRSRVAEIFKSSKHKDDDDDHTKEVSAKTTDAKATDAKGEASKASAKKQDAESDDSSSKS